MNFLYVYTYGASWKHRATKHIEMKKTFTLSVFTANKAGILHRVTTGFTRRKINIESITASPSEVDNIHRYTIVVNLEEENVKQLVTALEKQIEVHKAFYHSEQNVVYQEIALYKIPSGVITHGGLAEKIVRQHGARMLAAEEQFTVIEKTGHAAEIEALFTELEPFNILEFTRSGRVAISKPMRELREYLEELEAAAEN